MGDGACATNGVCRVEAGEFGVAAFGPWDFAAGSRRSGVYGRWSCDGAGVEALSAPWGFYPLFYAPTRRGVTLAPSIEALLGAGVSSRLDDAALAVFLRLGFFVGDDTPFAAIKAVSAGGRLSWRDGRLDAAPRPAPERPWSGGRREAVETYAALFRVAIAARRPSGRVVAPLSGGRDSRHVFLELHAQGRPPDLAVTLEHFPLRSGEDARIAALVAQALGTPHRVVPQNRSLIAAETRKNRLTHFCADEHGWGLPMAQVAAEAPTTIYDGIGGDVLSAGLFQEARRFDLFEKGRIDDLAELLLGSDGMLDAMLSPVARRRFSRSLARERLAAELRAHMDEVNPVASFYFWNRTRREIALMPLAVYGPNVEIVFPYLEPELLRFLRSLPPGLTLDKSLHTETIAHAYPQHAALPYEDTGIPARPTPSFARRTAAELAARLIGSRSGFVRRGYLLPRYARGLIFGRYEDFGWLDPFMLIYLLDLEGVTAERLRRSRAPPQRWASRDVGRQARGA